MPRTQTKNQGAGDTRDQIKQKIRRLQRVGRSDFINGETLIVWIDTMDERAAKKAGGLGRR